MLGKADVVIYDRLASPALLGLVDASAELIDVGKRPGTSVAQEAINALLVDRGRNASHVVRLKGGDPFIFGRGAEEALALEEAGIAYEVVPGVTAATAVAAYAGVPITYRRVSASFSVVAGQRASEAGSVEWEALAKASDTIVVLMGVHQRAEIARRLMAGGKAPSTPVLAVRWGTRARSEEVRTTLGDLGTTPLMPPATLVIGEVARMHLNYAPPGPLAGLVVVLTRSHDQAGPLRERLEGLGAEVIVLPTVTQVDPSDGGLALSQAVERIDTYDWVVLSSPNGAARFLSAVADVRSLHGTNLAAIGPGTAAVLAQARLTPDLVPSRHIAEGLAEVFPPPPPGGGRVLLARAGGARAVLPDALEGLGWQVDVVESYRSVPTEVSGPLAAEAARADVALFAASSAVRSFCSVVDDFGGLAVCIGPATAATAAEMGLSSVVVARDHDIDGLVAAVIDAAPGIKSRDA